MSDGLKIFSLGGLRILLADRVINFNTRKAVALLVYLASTRRPFPREVLADLLWDERSQSQAASNLRVLLTTLRQNVGDYLTITRDTVSLQADAPIWLDANELQECLLEVHRSGGIHSEVGARQIARASIDLYQGEFLEGLRVVDCSRYEEWMIREREHLHHLVVDALSDLVTYDLGIGSYSSGLEHATRLLRLDPLMESAHRQMMSLLAYDSQRTAALAQYETCRRLLDAELQVSPSPETVALYESIRQGTLDVGKEVLPALAQEPPSPGPCPYKGLQFFGENDAPIFFGREALVDHLVTRLFAPIAFSAQDRNWSHFLAVIGASGSGKSSIARAGMIPTIRQSDGVVVHVITPGNHPLESLASSLAGMAGSVAGIASFMDDMTCNSRSLYLYINRLLRSLPAPERPCGVIHRQPAPVRACLVLVVDQFEELFSQCRDEAERKAFLDNLLYPASQADSPVYVVIALRADFYAACAPYERLREALTLRQEYIGPMSTLELRRAIEEPAKCGGWSLEPGLVDLFLRDVGAGSDGQEPEPGALPLLSHSLLETWLRRRGRVLTLSGYSDAGGVRGAIAQTAESVFGQLTPEGRKMARNIFLRMTELGEGAQETRRRVPLVELIPQAAGMDIPEAEPQTVLKILTDARLVTITAETAEVAHEALIREWSRLQDWLNEDREGLRLHRHLTDAAREWLEAGREPGMLYRGLRLAQIQEWAVTNPEDVNTQEREFLDESQALLDEEEAAREAARQRELDAAYRLAEAERERAETQVHAARRLRQRAIYLSLALISAFILVIVAGDLARLSSQNAKQAGQNLLVAQLASTQAISQQSRAQAASTQAIAQQSTAESEAKTRATAEAAANEQARLASARELAAAAIINLENDSQRSLLLAMQAVKTENIFEAVNALHQAIQVSRLTDSISVDTALVGVDFSPNGDRIAAMGNDGNIYLWSMDTSGMKVDPTSRQMISNPIDFNVTDTDGNGLAFSPDGKWLAGIAEKHSADIWDASTGKILHSLTGHTQDVFCITFSPDGQLVATGSIDNTVKIWDAANGKELTTLTGFSSTVEVVRFSSDGKQLAAGADDGKMIDWNLVTSPGHSFSFSEHFRVDLGKDMVGSLAFSPDGNRLAIGSIQQIRLYDIHSASPTSAPILISNVTAHGNVINGLNFNPGGDQLYSSSYDGLAKGWDTTTMEQIFTLAGKSDEVFHEVTNPAGTLLATAADGSLKLWDITITGNQEWFRLHDEPIDWNEIYVNQDRTQLVSWSSHTPTQDTFTFWNVTPAGLAKTPARVFTLSNDNFDDNYALNPDLSAMIIRRVDSDHRTVNAEVWNTLNNQKMITFPIFKSKTQNGPLCTVSVDCINGPWASPDDEFIFTLNDNGEAAFWDIKTGKQVQKFFACPTVVYNTNIRFSPDGTRFAIACADKIARVWNTQDIQSGAMEMEGVNFGFSLSFSPDGKELLSGSGGKTAMLWDVQTGHVIRTYYSAVVPLGFVAFSPDGKLFAAGANGFSQIWDTATGQVLYQIPGFLTVFSPDSQRVITRWKDIIEGYYLNVNDLMDLARSRLIRTWTQEECQTYLHTDVCPPKP
jgi:WD40 repeat protein/DNA-binding SARP family transcriptional activator